MIRTFKRGLGFQAKVLIPVVTVMVLLMAVTMWIVNRRISAQLESEALQQLESANNIFNLSQNTRAEYLRLRFRPIMKDTRYTPFIKAVEAEDADVASLAKTMGQFLQDQIVENEATIATCVFSQDGGHAYASARRDDQLDADEFQFRCVAAVRRAFEEEKPVSDTVHVGRRILDIVCIPIRAPYAGEVGGVVTFGVEIGAEAGREIKARTRSDILFLAGGQVAVSSLSGQEYYSKLAARFEELSTGHARTINASNIEITVGNQHFMCMTGQIASLSGDKSLGYLLLYEQPLAVLRETRQMLFLVGLLGILGSTAIVWLLVGKATQPLRQLRDSAEAVGHGDFSKRVEAESQDECGELASVFNQMTENLQTSRQELEKTVDTLKTTQNQLIQSEKLSGIGEFVAGVAHELNNPLTSVMGFAELLQQSDMPEQQRRYLDVIFKSAKRCQKVVSSLLSFARRHAPERKVESVNGIVESAVEILQYQMRTSNIEVVTELDPDLPASDVDPHQMQQVFLNIINNARQAMEGQERQGRLHVQTRVIEGRVRITFEDNGPGIPAENLKKIFNPFFTTKEVGKGTGLGLSLCYGIVSEHGGTITPQSKEGEGATFVIELPIAQQAAKATAEKKLSGPLPTTNVREGVGKRVLVIDDEDTILQMISEALTRNGYRVDVARDGESALRRLGQYYYDLALCDWKMPGLNGEQIYERLHASNPDMSRRLIFITGDVVNERTQEFLRKQDKVCLSKPFTLVEFRAAIRKVMALGPGTAPA